MKKTKILIVSSEFPPQPGGIGNHAYHLAFQLSQQDYEVKVVSDQRSEDGEEEAAFDKDLRFKIIRTKNSHPRFLMYLTRLRTLYTEIRSSSHIIATGKFSLWSVGFYSGFLKRRYFAVVHGTEVNFKSFWLKRFIEASLKRFHKIIAVSHYTKSLIAHLHLDVSVISNGIDFEAWKTSKQFSSYHLKGKPRLITVGNVTSRKGQQNVIKHLPQLIKIYPEIHYHCIGLKTDVADFNLLAKAYQVDDHLTFHGRLNNADLRAMLVNSDIFVMLSSETSTGDVEGFGIAILEANAIGVPAIGSLGCGIEDAIFPDHNGVLIPHNNSEALLAAIDTILTDRVKFKRNAIAWAKKHDWPVIILSYIDILK